mmetsp:Transcript_37489/g.43082  ORF Transcript_37489/g.43082 Transcript_37489/m.43082 type:complete len:88 (+) Transcript_37489:492-755(+)
MDSINFYFLSEFIDGKELFEYVQQTSLSEKTIVDIAKKLISVSMYLSNLNFQFSDLKPHTIFINEQAGIHSLKVVDFDYKITFDGTK